MLRRIFFPPRASLTTDLAGIELASPIVLAAGTCGLLDEMAPIIDLARVGALVTKSITPQPREGNQTWRLIPAGPSAMMNAIGLANPGLDAFLGTHLPRAATLRCKVFVSVAGFSTEDYAQCVANVEAFVSDRGGPAKANVHAIELNVSCPNVRTGTEFGHTPALIAELLGAVRPHASQLRLIAKLSPATPHLVDVCRAAISAGADALTLGNTYPAMAIDPEQRRPRLANTTGGLSGPAIHPIALKHVYDVHRLVTKPLREAPSSRHVPILALGGATNWRHGASFILAGATALQVGTALFADPRAPLTIADGLARWAARQKAASVAELRGQLLPPLTEPG
jgi:dihydroorotate dehydrogenase (NAD+) catalytic subunit